MNDKLSATQALLKEATGIAFDAEDTHKILQSMRTYEDFITSKGGVLISIERLAIQCYIAWQLFSGQTTQEEAALMQKFKQASTQACSGTTFNFTPEVQQTMQALLSYWRNSA